MHKAPTPSKTECTKLLASPNHMYLYKLRMSSGSPGLTTWHNSLLSPPTVHQDQTSWIILQAWEDVQ